VLHGENCQGLLALDATVIFDPSAMSFGDLSTTELTAGFQAAAGDATGRLELSMYGPYPLESDGNLLSIQVIGAGAMPAGQIPSLVRVEVNEGLSPVEVGPTGRPAGNRPRLEEEKRWRR
jgi:hypothetical protein